MVTWGANRLKWYSLVFPCALVKPWNVHDERLRVNDTERSKLRSEWFMHRTISFISLNFPRIHMLLGGNSLSKEILPMLPISTVLSQAVRAVRLGWTQTCSLDAKRWPVAIDNFDACFTSFYACLNIKKLSMQGFSGKSIFLHFIDASRFPSTLTWQFWVSSKLPLVIRQQRLCIGFWLAGTSIA